MVRVRARVRVRVRVRARVRVRVWARVRVRIWARVRVRVWAMRLHCVCASWQPSRTRPGNWRHSSMCGTWLG